MTPDPDTSTDQRGRHASPEDDEAPEETKPEPEDDAKPPSTEEEAPPEDDVETPEPEPEKDDAPPTPPPPTEAPGATRAEPEQPRRQRSAHSLGNHPAGFALLLCSGIVTGIALAPLLFDQLRFDVATDAARAARSAATTWPDGGEPWFWPSWLAALAALVAVAVLVLAILGLRVPDVVVLGVAVVLTLATARAAWATLAVINSRLWELIPLCILCLAAFGLAATALMRWRSPDDDAAAGGGGEAAAVAFGGWLLVALLLLAGAAIASSAETNAGAAAGPPQNEAGLLSVRSADGPQVADLRGRWVPQLAAAQVTDDTAATAFSARHQAVTARSPAVLIRGDDVDAPDLDDRWWLSLGTQNFGSSAEVERWCASVGLARPDCAPRLVTDQ